MDQTVFEWNAVRRRRCVARRGQTCLGVAVALLLAVPTGAASPGLFDHAQSVAESLADPLVSVPHADAMADCAERIFETRVEACELVPATLAMRHSFWIWRNEEGATVSRARSGGYRIRSGSCIAGFCSWRTCRVTAWPQLACSDGGTLTASVPDPGHFVLSGTSYRRVRSMH